MNLFRIHIMPDGGNNDRHMTFQYCTDNQILGVGWRINEGNNTNSWEEYEGQAQHIHKNLNQCRYIYNNVRPGDLVWTRDLDANYYLAQVLSGWEYFETEFSINANIDIANIFRYKKIFRLELEEVPGSVVNAFIKGHTIQRILNPKASAYSKYIWNKKTGCDIYNVEYTWDIFTLLDPEQVEDLVFLYLQTLGWYVVPSSRMVNTMRFEYMVLRPDNRDRGFVQVKTGDTQLFPIMYANDPGTIFLFQSNEFYVGEIPLNVTCIKRVDLLEFVKQSLTWLPRIFAIKLSQVVNHVHVNT